MEHLYKFGGMHRPKGTDEEDDAENDDEIVRKNTHANSVTSMALEEEEMGGSESESDAETKSSQTSDNSDDDDATSDADTDATESDVDFDQDEYAAETPAMLAKKTATAASTLANSDAKKKAVIATKKAIASSKPPKGKATLQDITTLQQSYDDVALDEGDNSDESDGDDDNSDDGTNYLRKFDSEVHENYIASCHQEMMHLNTAEVASLVRVVRNADGAIVDVMHKTMPFMTKYEKTRILGQRAKQLNQGAQPLIPVDKKIIDGYLIAQLELQQKALPFIIRRPLPGGKSEYWRVSDLELI